MIKLIRVQSYLGDVYINPLLVAAIDFQREDAYVRTGQTDYRMSHENALAFIAELQSDSKPQTALDELVLTKLVSFQRDETRNNARPMWRCITDDDEPVNIFLNKDEPEKDSYQLFKAAGYGKFLDDFGLHQLRVDTHIQIAMKKNGRFWEVVKVRTKPQSDMPDWAKENYLFDEIVTEEDETEGGAE